MMQFIESQHNKLIQYYGNNSTDKERILARTVKLVEEVGELCNEVLAYHKDQRKEKLAEHDEANLPHEFADVIITTLLLARAMDVDVSAGLKSKIEKINKRFEAEHGSKGD